MKKPGKAKIDPVTPVKQSKPVLAKTSKRSQKTSVGQADAKKIRVKPFD